MYVKSQRNTIGRHWSAAGQSGRQRAAVHKYGSQHDVDDLLKFAADSKHIFGFMSSWNVFFFVVFSLLFLSVVVRFFVTASRMALLVGAAYLAKVVGFISQPAPKRKC